MKVGDLVKYNYIETKGIKSCKVGIIIKHHLTNKCRLNGKTAYLAEFYDIMWSEGVITQEKPEAIRKLYRLLNETR